MTTTTEGIVTETSVNQTPCTAGVLLPGSHRPLVLTWTRVTHNHRPIRRRDLPPLMPNPPMVAVTRPNRPIAIMGMFVDAQHSTNANLLAGRRNMLLTRLPPHPTISRLTLLQRQVPTIRHSHLHTTQLPHQCRLIHLNLRIEARLLRGATTIHKDPQP